MENHRKQNFWKETKDVFYWRKIIENSSYEIFGSIGFKAAFINKNKTLNKRFNSSII